VKIVQDPRFREQRERFRLRFTCEDCTLFDDRTEQCAHGYPTAEHRDAHYRDPDALVVFCKHFELG
jgi:hypothetical protein